MTAEDNTGTARLPTANRDDAGSAAHSAPAPGGTLGRYQIIERLGAGGMGEVFRASDPVLGRDVAIKIISGNALNAEARSRFEQEARAASALSHPNIITIFDIVSDGHTPFIVMELLEGRILRHVLDGPMPLDTLLRIAIQIVDGLAAAHERGIVHRDLKPDNIFVTRAGVAKLLDFGVVSIQSTGEAADRTIARLTAAGEVLGTFGYIAPEAAAGERFDFRVDQFSFGCMLYEMATGHRPFRGETNTAVLAATLREEPVPVSSLRPDLPLPLAGAIHRCLQKNPANRFASTLVLKELLSAILDTTAEVQAAPPPAPRLPVPPTPLVGREAEVQSIRRVILEERARLVALTGPGGSGKTRLALAAADSLSSDFRGAVFFAPLAAISDAELLLPTIGRAIGLTGVGDLEAIARRMRDTPGLLVLDNFEHLIEATRFISDLLASCPHLAIVVTSREVLRVYGERNIVVQPLELPSAHETRESAAANPSVALFVQRARSASSSFELTDANAAAVCALCRRLDGLPLAIELAAARIRLMTPQAMLERLEQRLPLLTAGSRDLPDRQQTLRSTLDWSHDLLTGDERALFRRLSVFAGGFTLEAAQAVADPFQKLSLDVMDGISSLLDKSLLWPSGEEEGDQRFMMLQTVRDYGIELLAASGEEPATRKAHAAYYVVLAQESEQVMAAGESPEWLLRLSREHDDIRAALGWLLKDGNVCWGLQLATAIFYYWERAEHLSEGLRWLNALLNHPGAPEQVELYARALFSGGVLAATVGDPARGVEMVERSREIARARGDVWGSAVASNAIGVMLRDVNDYERAAAALEESLEEWKDLGDRRNYARSLSNLAQVRQLQHDFDTAARLYGETEQVFRELGDNLAAAWEINHQGDVARHRAKWQEAERLYASALSAFRDLGDGWGIATSLVDLGTVAREQGRLPAAENLYSQSLDEFSRLGHQRGIARVLEALATLSVEMQAHARALTLAGAASKIRETISVPLAEEERQTLDQTLKKAREACGAAAQRAWQQGRTMPPADLLRLAQSWPEDEA